MQPPEHTEAALARLRRPSGVPLAALDDLSEAAVVLLPVRDGGGTVVDLQYDFVNRAAAASVGARPHELIGRRLRESLPNFPRELFAGLVAVLEEGEPLRTQVSYSDAFADRPPFSGRYAVSASRLNEGLLVVYDDLAARAQARATERRFGAVLEATSDWVSIADRDANLVYINAAGRRMVGIGVDEDITGRKIGEFSPEWARRKVIDEALEIARREGVWRGDMARLHRDGYEIPISQVIIARTAPDGEVDFYATIARDMTRERAAEAAMRESEERFRLIFEQSPLGVSLLDLDGNFIAINDAYCRIVRRSREDVMALGPVAITHPDDVAFTRYAIRLLLDGEVADYRFEKRYVDRAGETVWVEISAAALLDDAGRPKYLIGILQDLGERHVATTLQRSMMTEVPLIDGVDIAVRYLPGSPETEVSGDWYDVIPLADGRVGFVIGDVVGRGIEAAATMSQLRTALRAYAVEGLDPATVVAKLHHLVDQLKVGLSTTLVYLDFDPFTRELRYVSAGHLPALLVPAQGPSRFLPGARSTPLGTVGLQTDIPQERLVLAPGDAVLLYTDGLVERRDASIDARLEDLRRAVSAAPDDLDERLAFVTGALAGEEDALRPDDIALLILRTSDAAERPFEATISASARELAALRADLRAWLLAAGATRNEAGEILVAVGEACANAIEHAGTTAADVIGVRAHVAGRELVASVHDHGRWRPASSRPDRGHGLRLMRMLMEDVDIATGRDGTRVHLRRTLSRAAVRSAAPDEPAAAGAPVHPAALSIVHERGAAIATLSGEVDLARSETLSARLVAALDRGDRGLVLDLSGVDYLDSAGLHVLHDAARLLSARGQALRVVAAPSSRVLRLLELVGLSRSIPVDATVAAAVAALAAPH